MKTPDSWLGSQWKTVRWPWSFAAAERPPGSDVVRDRDEGVQEEAVLDGRTLRERRYIDDRTIQIGEGKEGALMLKDVSHVKGLSGRNGMRRHRRFFVLLAHGGGEAMVVNAFPLFFVLMANSWCGRVVSVCRRSVAEGSAEGGDEGMVGAGSLFIV